MPTPSGRSQNRWRSCAPDSGFPPAPLPIPTASRPTTRSGRRGCSAGSTCPARWRRARAGTAVPLPSCTSGGSRSRLVTPARHSNPSWRASGPAWPGWSADVGRVPSPAIVLGLGANGYGIVRSLARCGVPVLGTFTRPEEFGRLSRYCQAVRVPAEALVEGDRFVETLGSLARRFAAPPTVFATDDRHTLLLTRHRTALDSVLRFHAAPLECVEAVVDKAQMSRRCQETGILVPRTHVTTPDEDVARSAAGFSFPCVIKPARSFDAAVPRGFKTYTAASPKALLALYAQYPDLLGASIWQEVVEGADDVIFQFTTLVRADGDVREFASART